MKTDQTAGRAFSSRAAYEEHKRHRDSILNPPKPSPKIDAVKVLQGGRLFAGKRREEGEILLIMPEQLPPGFVSKEDARELIDNGQATPATTEEIEAFLAANEPPSNKDQ